MTKQINIQELEPFHIRSLMKMGASKIQLIERISTLHLKQLVYRLERIKDKSDYFDDYILEFNSWLEQENWWDVRESIIQLSVEDITRPSLPSSLDWLNGIKNQLDPKYKYALEQANLIKVCLPVLLNNNNSEGVLADTLENIILFTPLTIDHVSIINSNNSTQDRTDDLNKFIKALVDKNPNISTNEVITKINIEFQKLDSFIEDITDGEIEWTNKKGLVNERINSTPLSAISNRLTRVRKKQIPLTR